MDMPWTDRAGRTSKLRIAALLLILGPALVLVIAAATGGLGAKPLTKAIHETGEWAVRFLLLSLAITPLRRITGRARFVTVRRLIGLAAYGYVLAHFALFAADQGWNPVRIGTEIASRVYLAIGLLALLGLTALAVTSTDAWIRRLGPRWHALHRIIHACAALALLHFFMQSKIDADQASFMAGLFLLLTGYRLAHRFGAPLASPALLAAVAAGAAVGTAALEAAWYGLATRIPWQAVLSANLTITPEPRPAFWVLVTGLAIALLALRRGVAAHRPGRER